jgi:putative ABC transport system permease protein
LITGLAHPKGLSFTGRDQDDMVTMPYTTAMKRITGDTKLSMISVKAASENVTPQVEQDIIALLRQRHQITGMRDDDFTVRTQQEIAEMATATQTTLRVLLLIIACVSLVVGGIGIMNIMLVSVTERTREIGIRMAVGAHGSDIMLQFLIESVTLSALGGLIGIVLGIGTSRLVTIFKGWPTQISPTVVMLSFGFSAAIGVFFGLYPARKAAALDPIDALRYE